MEPEVQAKFDQLEAKNGATEARNQEFQQTVSEFIAQTEQIVLQLQTVLNRYDKVFMGDGQTHGTLVRMAQNEDHIKTLRKDLDAIRGRPTWAIFFIVNILAMLSVGLLVARF